MLFFITFLGIILCIALLLITIDERKLRQKRFHEQLNYACLEIYSPQNIEADPTINQPGKQYLDQDQLRYFSSDQFKIANGYPVSNDDDDEDTDNQLVFHPVVSNTNYANYVSLGRYSIYSSQYSIGRKCIYGDGNRFSMPSIHKIDILGPSGDMKLARNAATLFLENGAFYLKLHQQPYVWIRKADATVTRYCNPARIGEKLSPPDFPSAWRANSSKKPTFITGNLIPIDFGDDFFMGETLFEFVSDLHSSQGGE